MAQAKLVQRTKKEQYLKNDDLVAELKLSVNNGLPTEKLAKMFKLIALNRSRSFRYDNEDDRKDVVSTAVYILLKKFDKFDFSLRTNAFSYFTQIATNAIYYGWNQLNANKPVTYSIDQIFSESI